MAKVKSSITGRLLLVIVAYAALLAGGFLCVNQIIDTRLNYAFPSIDNVTPFIGSLAKEDYSALRGRNLANCVVAVFDEHGNALFASDKRYVEDLSKALGLDLADDEYERLSGFAGFDECSVEKRSFQSADGGVHTLVTASPILDMDTYQALIDEAARLWLVLIPYGIVVTVVAAVVAKRVVRAPVMRLAGAIKSYQDLADMSSVAAPTPMELAPIRDGFQDLMTRLEGAQSERRRIIADVSHDLKTPLTVIGGYAQALCDGVVPSERRDEYLQTIARKSHSAAQLIDELFVYAKTEHPDYCPHLARTDLCELARLVVIDKLLDAEQFSATMEADIEERSLYANVDPQLVRRILNNLIDNALKHNCAGVSVKVSCRVRCGKIVLAVSDTGQGMPDAMRAHAFEAFVTSNVARTTSGGTGLGLAIAVRCAQLNGAVLRFADATPPFVTSIGCVFDQMPQDKGQF